MPKYVDSNLGPGEQVLYRADIHWAIFLPGATFTALATMALAAAMSSSSHEGRTLLGLAIVVVLFVGIIHALAQHIARVTTEMAVTNKRVITKKGLISRRTVEMNIGKVENIAVDQGLIGRLMNFGTVTVVGTGGTREPFNWVLAPLEFRRAVHANSPH